MSETGLNQGPSGQALLFDLIRELKDSVAKLADKMDNINERVAFFEGADLKTDLEGIESHLKDFDSRFKELEEKVTKVSTTQGIMLAIVGGVGGFIGFIGGGLKDIFGGG